MFAKILEYEEGQILITKELDNDKFKVSVRFDYKDLNVNMSIPCDDEESRDQLFDATDTNEAIVIIDSFKDLVNND